MPSWTNVSRMILMGVLVLIWHSLAAQPYYFKSYTIANGLSYNTVFCMLQDEQGFLWFGTRDGLNRFDGYTFKVFRNDPSNPGTIGNNAIYSLFQDANNQIWVGTQGGLYRYHADKESFSLLAGTQGKSIRDVKTDGAGNLWYIAEFTLCRYDQQTSTTQTYQPGTFFEATAIAFDTEGVLWVATNNGFLHRHDAAVDTFASHDLFNDAPPNVSRRIERLQVSAKHGLVVLTAANGMLLFNPAESNYRPLLPPIENSVKLYTRAAVFAKDDECWVATENGVYIYHFDSDTYTHLSKATEDPYALNDNAIHSILKDDQGGLWVGTYFGGLNYYAPQHSIFEKFYPTADPTSISGHIVREICADPNDGNLWVGTEDGGLNKFDPKKKTFRHFKLTTSREHFTYTNIHGLLQRGNELWIGTYEHGLAVMDARTGKIKREYFAGIKGLTSNFVVCLYETKQGAVLVGTATGLFRYDEEKDFFFPVEDVPEGVFVSSIMQTEDGNIWVATRGHGLCYFNPQTGNSVVFRHNEADSTTLSSDIITAVYQAANGQLWVATENGGICAYHPANRRFERYRVEDGLPSNHVFGVAEDNDGQIWISTAKGLAGTNPVTGRMDAFTTKSGLPSDQFNYNSAYRDRDGNIYFGSAKGLVRFDPNRLNTAPHLTHRLYITGFQVDNEELRVGTDALLKKSIIQTDTVNLPYHKSTISIDFAALYYGAPQETQYMYQLEGFDEKWVHLETNRKVYFTKLPPGKYLFRVKARSHNGAWSGQSTDLAINVSPPFWATPWAFSSYAAVLITAIALGITWYHRYLNGKNQRKMRLLELQKQRQIALLEKEKEKEIYHAKIEFFTHVTHEIKTPLTLIKAPLERAKYSNDLLEIKGYLDVLETNNDYLVSLTTQLLDLERTESTAVALHYIQTDVAALLSSVYKRFASEADLRKLTVSWHTDNQPLKADIDPEAVTTIFSNLLSNAIKFADKHLIIHLRQTDGNQFYLAVENDGEAIPEQLRDRIFEPFFKLESSENASGTGIGLALTKSLVELHGGTISFEQTVADIPPGNRSLPMNRFTVELPARQKITFMAGTASGSESTHEIAPTDLDADNKPVVLLVDDHQDILQFVTRDLRQQGFDVLTAENGQQALDIVDNYPVHLVISDVMMPVLDGLELCEHLKSTLEHSHIPVILLTAKSQLDARVMGLESGADAYIEKPFSPRHLVAQAKSLLHNRDSIRKHYAESPLAHIDTLAHSKADKAFLDRIQQIIHEQLNDPAFDIGQLADKLFMSRSTLFRKIKQLSGTTPNELITITRLKKAAELLATGGYRVYEVAAMTGFNSAVVFGRAFSKQFGVSPTNYVRNARNNAT